MNTINIQPNRFLLHWVVAALSVWIVASVSALIAWTPVAIVISVLDQYPIFALLVRVLTTIALFTLPGLTVGYVLGDMQSNLLHDFFNWQFKGTWVRSSSIGGLLGSVLAVGTSFLVAGNLEDHQQWMMLMPLFMLPMSIMQWRILRAVVRDAWLWILGNVVGAIVFSGLLFTTRPLPFVDANPLNSLFWWAMAATSLGIITGIVMLWLYEHPLSGIDEESELAPVYIEVRNHDER